MNAYEKILKVMAPDTENNIFVTTMESSTTCYVNNLKLEREDLLIAEHLTTGWLTQKDGKNEFIKPLSKGDMVLLIKLDDTKYAIVERMV